MNHLRKLEESLLRNEVRTNRSRLNKILHESFIEIGYSGKTYTKADVLNELTNESEAPFVCWSQDYKFITLATDLILVIYKKARMDVNGELSRHAKRTSIWFNSGSEWQLKFHQGTPTQEFEKLSN